MKASVAFLAIIISAAAADESNNRSEVQLGFGGWTAQGDKIEKTQRADGEIVIKITGNVLLWTLNRDGKATVASMDFLESSDKTLTLRGYPVLAEGEGMMTPSPHIDPEFALTVKDGKITSQSSMELSGTLGESERERTAFLAQRIEQRKEIVRSKLIAITTKKPNKP
jgi:hypothetical protein